MTTVTLYRPVGQDELDHIRTSGWRRFPPRLEWQPIFYPVIQREYACEIARKWTAAAEGIAFVMKFHVDASYISRFSPHVAGGKNRTEYWIDADVLSEFNDHIVGQIELIAEFRRDGTD